MLRPRSILLKGQLSSRVAKHAAECGKPAKGLRRCDGRSRSEIQLSQAFLQKWTHELLPAQCTQAAQDAPRHWEWKWKSKLQTVPRSRAKKHQTSDSAYASCPAGFWQVLPCQMWKSFVSFAAGAAYGLTSVAVGQPFDTVKTRMCHGYQSAFQGQLCIASRQYSFAI